MPKEPPGTSKNEVEIRLKRLYDSPAHTSDTQDTDLVPLQWFLMHTKPEKDGRVHWFCPKADDVVREAATFLLRLFAYNNEKVVEWKEQLVKVLHGCAPCVRGLEEIKESSKTTYFGAFNASILARFWEKFESWEVETVVEGLKAAGITPDTDKKIADVHLPLVYHLLTRVAAFKDSFILNTISARALPVRIGDWPMDPPPPGILLLVAHRGKVIREWAIEQSAKAKGDISQEQFSNNYEVALQVILSKVSPDRSATALGSQKVSPLVPAISACLPFSDSPTDLWVGLTIVIRLTPAERLDSFGIHRIIFGHLHDSEPHFREVLRCMLGVTRKLGKKLWVGESDDYPQVVFDSIKDNPAYLSLVVSHPPSEKAWFLLIFLEYLGSIWEMDIFGEVLAKFAAFTFDELQHERFEEKRPLILNVAMQILSAATTKAIKSGASAQYRMITNVLEIHSDLIIAVAFSSDYNAPDWVATRQTAMAFVRSVLTTDIENVTSTVNKLSVMEPTIKSVEIDLLLPSIRRQVWQKVYSSITGKDVEGVALVLSLVARTAKLDQLRKRSASRRIWKHYEGMKVKPPLEILQSTEGIVDAVNDALSAFRGGALDAITRFADQNNTSVLLGALREKDLTKNLISMILSPVEDLHVAAQVLIGQAFDVDGRAECFREMFNRMAEQSYRGLYSYLSSFNVYALHAPEACNVSKSLVRCLTDIIEVLSNSPDGLLRDEGYVKKVNSDGFSLSDELPKLWRVMCTSIAVIFRRTPQWAVYYDNDTMTEWMRDALIFARDLLARRRAFEAAALTSASQGSTLTSPRKVSSVGKKLVGDLQDVLLELQTWLRLTDEELLYQSFALLKSLFQCFQETGVTPKPEALAKLNRFIDANKQQEAGKVTKLSPASLAELEVALAGFEDDEIEIISVNLKKKPDRKLKLKKEESPDIIEILDVIEVKPKVKKEPSTRPSKDALKKKQTKISFPTQPSSSSTNIQRSNQIQRKPLVSAAIPPKHDHRGIKFEGSTMSRPSSRSSVADLSSDEDSNDSDDDGESGLTALAKLENRSRVTTVKQPIERRQIKIIDDPMTNARNAMKERLKQYEEARRDANRLKPDITPLHRAILSWNYDHEGSEPPFIGQKPTLIRVPERFKDHQEYFRVFEPLLMLECWSQIVKSKEEMTPEMYECKIAARSFVDDWLDLDLTLTETVRKDWRLAENTDVVLLRHPTTKASIMAKVSTFRRILGGIQITVRCCIKSHSSDPGLIVGSDWRINSVFSLSTLHREFSALVGLPYYDMANTILRPNLPDPVAVDVEDIEQASKAYQVNEPQARAILSSLKTQGFSLIQGPPGTGKTWTICGLAGAFLSSRRRPPTPIVVANAKSVQTIPVQKILVCAPSNAAIDEVAKRLMEGVRNSQGQRMTPIVVRAGADSSINVSVKEISLDTLVENKMNAEGSGVKGLQGAEEIGAVREEIETNKKQRQAKTEEINATVNNSAKILALEHELKTLNAKRTALSQKFDRLKDKQRSENRTLDAIRRRYRHEVLAGADIICSTLSGAGHEQLEPFDYAMIIIDEAAQAIELSSLIPLKYRCGQCIMVGDPQQLPPTVLSPEASKWGYDQSLFVRMQKHRPEAVHLLSIQYRMHPDISRLPSKVFYYGRLLDGPDMDQKTTQPWHSEQRFGVYRFFSAMKGREEPGRIGHSLVNREECRLIAALYDRLRKQFSSVNFDFRVGIVSMYRAQVQELRRTFQDRFGVDIIGKIDFNTVDGFQGQEKDIIILSCVRAGPALTNVGFLADVRRINVAITRSRSSLYIVGHGPTLERSNATWKGIVEDARSRACYVELADASYFTKNFALPAVRNAAETAQIKPEPLTNGASDDTGKLFAPKEMKSNTRGKLLKLPKGAKVNSDGLKAISMQTNGLPKPLDPPPNPLLGQKRTHEGQHDEGPPPKATKAEHSAGQTSVGGSQGNRVQSAANEAGPSTSQKRPLPQDHGPQHPPMGRQESKDEKEKAAKALQAYQKRKKEATNNPFLTGRR